MGCNERDLKILVCQKHYIDKSSGFLELYDKYYPYKLYNI